MDKSIIIKYIDNGKELELLDKLRAYQIKDFNSQFKNLLKILLVLIEKSTDHLTPQQYFYRVVTSVIPKILDDDKSEAEFFDLIKGNSIPNYVYTSDIIRQFIIAIIDKEIKIDKYVSETITEEKLIKFKTSLSKLNVFFLKEAIKQRLSYEAIIATFYSSVSDLKEERKIIIDHEAIQEFRSYLTENPADYLASFIRPLYSGGITNHSVEYFLHVPEPFYQQIFNNEQFSEFLQNARKRMVDQNLVNDVESFYNEVITRKSFNGNKSLLLENDLVPGGLPLKSRKHRNVRPEYIG